MRFRIVKRSGWWEVFTLAGSERVRIARMSSWSFAIQWLWEWIERASMLRQGSGFNWDVKGRFLTEGSRIGTPEAMGLIRTPVHRPPGGAYGRGPGVEYKFEIAEDPKSEKVECSE